MPWKEASIMSLRVEFVTLAKNGNMSFRDLCRRYNISPKTGYKWLKRFQQGGREALQDLSRRPHHSPNRSSDQTEQAILQLRDQHPAWGPRKIHAKLSEPTRPAISTVAAVLKRHGRIDPQESLKHNAWQRFEAEAPNFLWQMDFKGRLSLVQGGRCHPLTVLDDHSRFLLGLQACPDEKGETVKDRLTYVFRQYGLPKKIMIDNGPPWGSDWDHPYTPLVAWLIRLGITVGHSRAYHPQTMGKDERLHRTLQAEVLNRYVLQDFNDAQQRFDRWRDEYNLERPHQAIGMDVPASRYRPSQQEFPEDLPPIDYRSEFIVRKVQAEGEISFRGKEFKVGRAFRGYPVGLLATATDGLYDVYFCHQTIAKINLKDHNTFDGS